MKILQEGNKDARNWWVGKTLRCQYCCQVVALEAGDEECSGVWVTVEDVTVQCSNCHSDSVLKRRRGLAWEILAENKDC